MRSVRSSTIKMVSFSSEISQKSMEPCPISYHINKFEISSVFFDLLTSGNGQKARLMGCLFPKSLNFFLVFFSHVNFLCSTEDQGNCHDHLSSLFYQNQHRLSTDPHTTWLAFLSKGRPSANTALFQEIKCLYILPPFDSFQTRNKKERKKETL